MMGRPLKLPGHRPIAREDERTVPEKGTSGTGGARRLRSAERRHPLARCLSRGRQAPAPPSRAVLDAAALREAALRRLQRLAETVDAHGPGEPEVCKELVDALLHCRAVSLDLVEAFDRWRISGSRGGMNLDPEYLVNMKDDTRWLAESPLADFLHFSDKSDPFFVVPSCKEPHTPSNPMTATLQAKLRAKQRCGAQLPLQAPLLRRIRKAELVIMKESMQARLAVSDERRKKTRPASPAPHFGAKATPAAANDTSTAYRPVHQVAYAEAEVKSSESLAPRPKPAKVEKIDLGAYSALPWNVSDSTAQELFEKYIERVPEALVQNTDTWQALETSLKGSNMDPRPVRGPYALEFFWLKSRAPDSDGKAPNAETAEGLCVFQLQRSGGKPVGQLRHFSVVSMDIFEDALTSVKNLMFTRLPIMSIRYVIWCREKGEDGKLKANNEVEDVLKSLCFRWFRFENNRGVRGKEMNRPRGENDPTLPLEVPSLEICLGQVWLRGANANTKAVAYTGNLALAAGCLRALRGKDVADAPPPESLLDAVAAAAWATCKKSLQDAVFSGALDQVLQHLQPMRLENAKSDNAGSAVRSNTALTCHMVKQLEEGLNLPEVMCQAVNETEELVRRGLTHAALKQATEDMNIEQLTELVAQRAAKDGCFGRMVVTLEWQHVNVLDENSFEVPVFAAARCSSHPHPLMYLSTSEEGMFVVLIPWHGLAVKEEDFFSSCTYLLRDATPMEPSPIASVQLFNLDVRQGVRSCNVDATSLEMGPGKLNVMDFSSLSVNSGRLMPGKLFAEIGEGQRFTLQRPFAFCLWHNDMDELNAPLFATMVR